MKRVIAFIPNILAIVMSAVFLDSLRFKFTNDPKTIQIFQNLLDNWAGSFGAQGLFAQTGVFSQYVIGSGELVTSFLLLVGIIGSLRHLQALGGVFAAIIMSGAVYFHLFTPLTTDPNHDGGGLFVMACFNLICGFLMFLVFRRKEGLALLGRLAGALGPQK